MKQVKLNLGCGVHLLKGWVNVDNSFTLKDLKKKKGVFAQAIIEPGAKFVQAEMQHLPFKDKSVDYIECLEAIEHLPFKEVELAIAEMHRVLKVGGSAYIFTTDFDDIAKMWVDHVAGKQFHPQNWFSMVNIIYGSQVHPGELHRSMFNPVYFNGLMQACGFKDFKMIGYPRGSLPPKFKGAKWPKKPMGCAMIGVLATKI